MDELKEYLKNTTAEIINQNENLTILKNRYIPNHSKSQRFNPSRLKVKRLLSTLNTHLINITLREYPKPIFLHMIKVLKIRIKIDKVKGKIP